jgi:UDP-N-acetylmuramoyl-tripeptide--D-alanyl-D-alanine ligase
VDIRSHPIWSQVTPYKTKIPSYKKPFHLLRFKLSRQYAKLFPQTMFVGITGSVGKTTTIKAAALVLEKKFKILTTKTNLDPILNIPETILKIRPSVKKVILEYGIEYPGEMDFYLSIVKPAVAVVTTITYQHTQNLGNLEGIAAEKGKLVERLPENGLAILNYDDLMVRKLAEKTKAQVIFFGTDPNKCQVWAGNIKIEQLSTSFEINYGVERVKIVLPMLGEHLVYACLAAVALGLSEGISLITAKNALEKITPEEHRLNVLPGYNNSLIIDDTYNSSPLSVEAALDVLQNIPARRRILVLGETKELGKFSEVIHRKIAQRIFNDRIDIVFLGTGDANYVYEELKSLGYLSEKMEVNLQNPQIVSKLLKILGKGDVCLIKGSRALRLDEVVERVVKKNK